MKNDIVLVESKTSQNKTIFIQLTPFLAKYEKKDISVCIGALKMLF